MLIMVSIFNVAYYANLPLLSLFTCGECRYIFVTSVNMRLNRRYQTHLQARKVCSVDNCPSILLESSRLNTATITIYRIYKKATTPLIACPSAKTVDGVVAFSIIVLRFFLLALLTLCLILLPS